MARKSFARVTARRTPTVLVLSIALASSLVHAQSYEFRHKVTGLKVEVPVRAAADYTLEERKEAWREYAIRNSLSYDLNWNEVYWRVASGEPLPDAPFPNNSMSGRLRISGAPFGEHSFSLLQRVSETLYLEDNYDRTDLSAFPQLAYVRDFWLSSNSGLESFKGAPNLTFINHQIYIMNDAFYDFESLKLIRGGLSDYTSGNVMISKDLVNHPQFKPIPGDAYICRDYIRFTDNSSYATRAQLCD